MNGHYKTKTIKTIIHYAIGLGFFVAIGLGMWLVPTEMHVEVAHAEPTQTAIFEDKVKLLEDDILAQLASCESGGTEEPEAIIILDTNDAMSIGKYQWQIKSLQHYAHVFYHAKLSRKEAILLALDAHDSISLDEITKKVIFEDSKGLGNWYNCTERKGLEPQVDLIKKIR